MRYLRLKIWFALRVAFFAAVFSFPTLASASPHLMLMTYASFGIIIGILAFHYFYKEERFIFQNLGIKKRELYLFATLFIWGLTFPVLILATLIYG